jgi:hypothetical protein
MKSQPILLPKGHTNQASHSVADRTKHSRLYGADLYVARLGWRPSSSVKASRGCCTASDTLQEDSSDNSKSPSGSLHDELLNSQPRTPSLSNLPAFKAESQPSVLASRPCYRCISYMHSVGIKRVFWTTDTGEWECAKVRDLVDALDNLGNVDMTDTATALSNVFVTKHEVLMLRRTMFDS